MGTGGCLNDRTNRADRGVVLIRQAAFACRTWSVGRAGALMLGPLCRIPIRFEHPALALVSMGIDHDAPKARRIPCMT